MKIKKNYIVSVLVCIVLFLASCIDESLVDNPHAQNALRTVSVDLGMPQDKPSYADGTTSRAALDTQTAEILLGDSTLAVSRAEGSSEATLSGWANNDQVLVSIEAGSIQARLTLKYIVPAQGENTTEGWYLAKANSYVTYTGTAFTAYNDVTPLFAEDTYGTDADMPISGTLTMHIDYTSTATQAEVSIIYAPDMEWSLAQVDNTVSMKQKANATPQTTAPELWTVAGNAWTTNQARLRVNTGGEGDVVTLTSSAFDSAWEVEPTVGEGENKKTVFTAVTDDYGDAYFYGATVDAQGNPSALTDGFLVQLTKMRVAVPSSTQTTSEGRSVSLENENTLLITLDTPITLLEASDVVPVTLAAKQAYKLMAKEKRNAAKTENINSLSVIDGQATSVDAVKKQIETAVAMGITEFTVINALREYTENGDTAGTVVGEAISKTTTAISISVAHATSLPNNAFKGCSQVSSFAFQKTIETIGTDAFSGINENSTLTLTEAQLIHEDYYISAANSQPKWGNATWASITIQNTDGTTSPVTACGYLAAVLKYETVDGTERVVLDSPYPGEYLGAVLYVANKKEELLKKNFVFIGNITEESKRGFEMASNIDVTDIDLYIKDATDIIESAFYGCTYLTHVTLGATGETTIGSEAFRSCTSLQSITLSASTAVGALAFSNCSALTTINNIDKIKSIGSDAFNFCTSLTSMVLPAAITEIADYTFNECNALRELTFSAVITAVGTNAFDGYESNTSDTPWTANCDLTLAAGQQDADDVTLRVTASNSKLMWADYEWKSITVGDKVYTQETTQETSFVKLTIGGTETYAVIDGMYGNYTGDGGTEVLFNTYRENVKTQIEAAYTAEINSFYVINELGTYKYTITENVGGGNYEDTFPVTSSVVGQAFTAYANENTDDRVSITLADATTVPESAFNGCTALTDINLDKVASIGNSAFYGCTALTSVTTAATSISTRAFYGCTNLQSATFTSTNTEIKALAFSKCTNLEIVSWDMVTSIGDNAFSKCNALVNVSSSTVTTVGNSAFSYCTSLKTVSLPEVRTLNNTFSYCSALEEVYSPEVTTLTSVVFENCTSLKQLTLGNVTSVYLEQDTHSFTGANTEGCALTLGAGQQETTIPVSASGGQLMWAGKQWQSITVGEIEFKAVGNELYMLIADDGHLEYPEVWGEKIKKAIDSYNLTSVYVTGNSLSIYNGNQAYHTVVGEAILSLDESYNGRISLVLAEAAAIPANAFSGCKALQSVVANNVTTIGTGAFYECTQITAITFGKVITEVGNFPFGPTNQEVEPWTISCALNLAAGQDSSALKAEYSNPYWAEYEWGTIKVGDVTYYPGGPI